MSPCAGSAQLFLEIISISYQHVEVVCKGTNGRCKRDFKNGYHCKYAGEDMFFSGVRAYHKEEKLCGQWLNMNTAAKFVCALLRLELTDRQSPNLAVMHLLLLAKDDRHPITCTYATWMRIHEQ